ncbi:glycoside hydrolase family 130 protein [Cohnella mopanensis]|uniref:glycoside hydrolase family 130 protein n=1 Tax=Cohnella mopanensis TaxID=2911966 RepID=UPI001EF8A205|nr:glycoside hydrolase family 130 protein [Cohnella mopanensis]
MTGGRLAENPIIKVSDVKPSRPDFKVVGAFNAGVAAYGDETILLVRVAEMPAEVPEKFVAVPLLNEGDGQLEIQHLSVTDSRYTFDDSRVVKQQGRYAYLTSMSHLRVARSKDGVHFVVDEKPSLFPTDSLEAWGIEDPRITGIGDKYYITYSAVSSKGVAVRLATTDDFVMYEKQSILLPPENKDAAIFPELIHGKYYMLHRPVPKAIGSPEMWIAESPDMIHWGNHRFLMGLREGSWDGGRMGGGAVPLLTEEGWLELYHGADSDDRYCMGAVLLDKQDPGKVLARSRVPLLSPDADYEAFGFFGGVVFSCGALLAGRTVRMYYGAADEVMARADFTLEEIYRTF